MKHYTKSMALLQAHTVWYQLSMMGYHCDLECGSEGSTPHVDVDVFWDDQNSVKNYQVTLKICSLDKRNGVADMINALNSTKASIVSVSSVKNSAGECITKFKLQVSNVDDLNHAIVSLNKISEIYSIERIFK